MSNDEEGQKAINELNETEFEGKTIAVSVARPRTERPSGGRNVTISPSAILSGAELM